MFKKLLLFSAVILAGCASVEPVAMEPVVLEPEVVEPEVVEPVVVEREVTSSPFGGEVISLSVPLNASDIKVVMLDFEGDGKNEKAVKYTLDDVVRREGDIRTISYMEVYDLDDNLLKNDEVTLKGGTVDSDFTRFEKVELGDKEVLLIRKASGDRRYYLFGLVDGELGDWPIPKGYLNAEKYLKEGDSHLRLARLEVRDNLITEWYHVFCPDVDWRSACWTFTLEIPFENGAFGKAKVASEGPGEYSGR